PPLQSGWTLTWRSHLSLLFAVASSKRSPLSKARAMRAAWKGSRRLASTISSKVLGRAAGLFRCRALLAFARCGRFVMASHLCLLGNPFILLGDGEHCGLGDGIV